MTTKTKVIKKPKISKKPSVAILNALEDLRAIEKNPKYAINMADYHNPKDNDTGKCEVCFAGAVIAAAGNGINEYIEPAMFDEDICERLYGLDSFRGGNISEGLDHFKITKLPRILCGSNEWDGSDQFNTDITPYSEDPTAFKKELKELALDLQALGL